MNSEFRGNIITMNLPKQLVYSYAKIKSSELICGGVITTENVRDFVNAINDCIPSQKNIIQYSIYKFNRIKYLANKQRFLNDIKGFSPYECMILWTDFNDILLFFGLSGKVFLGWDKTNNKYRGHLIKSDSKQFDKQELKQTHSQSMEAIGEGIEEAIDDDMHRVFEYMRMAQERMERMARIDNQ